jgi:hypothetical protein
MVDRVIAVGNEVREIGRFNVTYQDSGVTKQADGRFSLVLVREGDTWKTAGKPTTQSGSH